jgi:glycogen debranching enzyme
MPIAFDRTTCCDLQKTISREWLITNGLGGYAAGTVAGTLTRTQHGLLVASPSAEQARHPLPTPQVLLAKMDEEIVFDQRTYFLGTNEYKDGTLNPAGFVHLENFRLEEGFPVFTYHLGGIDGIVLEKRIWMPQGLNTTYISYCVVRTASPERNDRQNPLQGSSLRAARLLEDAHAAQRTISLTLLPYASYRAINEPLHGSLDWQFDVKPQFIDADAQEGAHSIAGCTIRARSDARPYHIFAVGHRDSQTSFLPTGVWYWNLLHREDQATDDLYLPGVFRAKLWPDVELTIIVTAEDLSGQTFNTRQLKRAYAEAVEDQRDSAQAQRYFGDGSVTTHMHPVLPLSSEEQTGTLSAEEFLRTLLQAGSRFLAHRALPLSEAGGQPSLLLSHMQTIPTILSGFFDAQELTRDSLIGLPGLILTTRRYAEARRILLTLSRYFKEGLLPDRLPTLGQPLSEEDYGSADISLWYFYALDAYLHATRDDRVLEDLFPSLQACITSLVRGTRNGIGIDPRDGLLVASQPGKALTWMNAYDGEAANKPLTPRSGKPVEVNALWYLALTLMQEWSEHLYQRDSISHTDSMYDELRQQCKRSFNERFWYEEGGYLYDVIDGPQGNDASLRPNQLFALSLSHPVLASSHRRAVLNIVAQRLLTPCGLRSLAPQSDGYTGHIPGRNSAREARARGAYNGGAWPWLMGAYFDALFQLEGIDDGLTEDRVTQPDSLAHKYALWRTGIELLDPYRRQLSHDLLGMLGSVYDGDEPRQPGEQVASARSVGELLRIYKCIAHLGMRASNHALTI